MPFTSSWEPHGLLTKWSGTATSAEMIRMQEQAHASPNFDSALYSIHDFSDCTRFICSEEDILYAAAIDFAASWTNTSVKIAIVAAGQDVLQATRTYMQKSPYELHVFASMEDARAWLQ